MDQAIHNGDRGGSRTSLGSRRADFASTESLQMSQQAPIPVNSLPPTDENVEVVLNLNVVIFTGVFDIKSPICVDKVVLVFPGSQFVYFYFKFLILMEKNIVIL